MNRLRAPERTWEAVESYFNELLIPSDPILDAAMKAIDAAGLPSIASRRTKAGCFGFWRACRVRGTFWKLARLAGTARFGSRGRWSRRPNDHIGI